MQISLAPIIFELKLFVFLSIAQKRENAEKATVGVRCGNAIDIN